MNSGTVVDTVVVFTGGDLPNVRLVEGLPRGAFVIAADSGLENAMSLGWHTDLVVGDLDSVRPYVLDAAVSSGADVRVYPVAKDKTDLELALDHAVELGPSRIVVVGGAGDRLDHFLANALVLAAPSYASIEIDAYMGLGRLHIVRRFREFVGIQGELVTLLPIHGMASGVSTKGLLYPLNRETLVIGSTRGVSNEMVATTASVAVDEGVLLVVRPSSCLT